MRQDVAVPVRREQDLPPFPPPHLLSAINNTDSYYTTQRRDRLLHATNKKLITILQDNCQVK